MAGRPLPFDSLRGHMPDILPGLFVLTHPNSGSKIIDITGHNYFQDLVEHIERKVGVSSRKEEEQKDDSSSRWLNRLP